MNDNINELKELFIESDVKSIGQGVSVLNTYLNRFEFHELKQEWEGMTKKDKQSFVKTLIESDLNTDDNTSKIVSETDLIFLEDQMLENIIDVEIEEISDDQVNEQLDEVVITTTDQSVEEKTECQLLLEQEVELLLKEREELQTKLIEINQKLTELGHTDQPTGLSKMEICRLWFQQNPKGQRADFMKQFKELGSQNLLSTYYQKLKPR